MSELAAKHLVRSGARATVLGGRTFEKAEELAAALGGRAAPFESLRARARAGRHRDQRHRSARHRHPKREDVEAARSGRATAARCSSSTSRCRATSRPRRAQARRASSSTTSTTCKSVAEANLRERAKEAAAAEAIVEQEVREFLDVAEARSTSCRSSSSCAGAPRRSARRRSPRRASGSGPLTPEQESALEAATTAIVNKLLHAPTVQLKELARQRPRRRAVGLVRRLLGLVSRDGDPHRDRAAARSRSGRPSTSRRASRRSGHAVELHVITTTGDRLQDRRLESRRRQGRLPEGDRGGAAGAARSTSPCTASRTCPRRCPRACASAPILERADPRDALVSARGERLAELPAGARVGTTSLRRRAQLSALRPDLAARGPARQRRHAPAPAARGPVRRDPARDGRPRAARPRRRGDGGPRSAQVCSGAGAGRDRARVPRGRRGRRAALAPLDHAPTARAVAAERALPGGAAAAAATSRSAPTRFGAARSSELRGLRGRAGRSARSCAASAAASDRRAISAARSPTSSSRGARALMRS